MDYKLLDEDLRQELPIHFIPDIRQLESLLGRDRSIWYKLFRAISAEVTAKEGKLTYLFSLRLSLFLSNPYASLVRLSVSGPTEHILRFENPPTPPH